MKGTNPPRSQYGGIANAYIWYGEELTLRACLNVAVFVIGAA